MTNDIRVARQPFTMTIPANHPALFCLGGRAFEAAASDLVDRARRAEAIALVEDPTTRGLMVRYQTALSTSQGPGEMLHELEASGITEFHGADYGDVGKSMAALLRECADEIDRAEEIRGVSSVERPDASSKTASSVGLGRPRKKPKSSSATELQRQPVLKLPITGGNTSTTRAIAPSAPQEINADGVATHKSRARG